MWPLVTVLGNFALFRSSKGEGRLYLRDVGAFLGAVILLAIVNFFRRGRRGRDGHVHTH